MGYILFRCKDEADGIHVDMHVYEGVHNGVSVKAEHCGDENYHDVDEYVEYENDTCAADGHGHHTHGDHGATNPVDSKDTLGGAATATLHLTAATAAVLAVVQA